MVLASTANAAAVILDTRVSLTSLSKMLSCEAAPWLNFRMNVVKSDNLLYPDVLCCRLELVRLCWYLLVERNTAHDCVRLTLFRCLARFVLELTLLLLTVT